jgi:hypothetical protein
MIEVIYVHDCPPACPVQGQRVTVRPTVDGNEVYLVPPRCAHTMVELRHGPEEG